MFSSQQFMDTTSEAPRKRARDDDLAMGQLSPSFGEHRNKRLHCLPLRSSPRQSHMQPTSFTAPDSGNQIPQAQYSGWSSAGSGDMQQDSEMDMMETLNSAPPSRLEAVRAESVAEGLNGRTPTPIQPSFAAQVRGQQNGWNPDQSTQPLNGVVNMGHQYGSLNSESPAVPRTMTGEAGWHSMQQNRRLPSPISEGDDSSNQLQGSSGACHDHEMMHPNAMMDVERTNTPPLDANGEPTTPSPKRGHVRNMHTVNNWTWQPGMKKSFSIGFRSDCEKCQMKVPGHFNHIIIS